jgi:hypothetical protein
MVPRYGKHRYLFQKLYRYLSSKISFDEEFKKFAKFYGDKLFNYGTLLVNSDTVPGRKGEVL